MSETINKQDSDGPTAPLLAGTLALIALCFLPLANGGYSGLGYQIGFVMLPLTAAIAWATCKSRPRIAGWVLLACIASGLFAFGWIQAGKTLWFNLMQIPAAWIAVWVLLRLAPKRAIYLVPVITGSAIVTAVYGWSLWLVGGSVHNHITSTFGLHNAYAGYLLLAWPVAALGAYKATKPLHGWLYTSAVLVLLATLVMTYSRASWLVMGLQLVLLATALAWDKTRGSSIPLLIKAMGAGALVLLLGMLAITPVRNSLASITNFQGYSMQGRMRFWDAAVAMFSDNPLLGVGPGNFAYVYPQYQRDFIYFSVDPHSWPLQLLCELGMVGVLVFGAVCFGMYSWVKRLQPLAPGNRLASFLVVAVGGSLLHAAFDFDYTFGATTALLGALLAYGTHLSHPHPDVEPKTISTGLRFRDTGIVLLLVFVAIAGESLTIERYSLDHLRDNPQMSNELRIELLTQAIGANPANHLTHYQLATAILASAPEPSLDEGFSLSPDADKKEKALSELDLALSLNPTFPRALAIKGLLTKPPWEGEKILEEALALDRFNYPEHHWYYAQLAENDEIERERLLAGMEAIPAHDPITPEHVRPTWYELNPLFTKWWYRLKELTDDPELEDLYLKRAVRFKVYWDGQQGQTGNTGDTHSS